MYRQFAVGLAGALTLLAACDGSVRREGPPEIEFQLVRIDAERNRRWVLELDAVTVYDNLNGRRLSRVILPDWVVAGPRDGCPPGLVIEASGSALISSNVLPVLWRVGLERFQVTRIDVELDSDTDKDVGFSGLSLASDGALLASGSTIPSQWRIDLARARATKLATQAPAGACDPGLVSAGVRDGT
jgi:hypothetical protein